jgi:hypothetical protein
MHQARRTGEALQRELLDAGDVPRPSTCPAAAPASSPASAPPRSASRSVRGSTALASLFFRSAPPHPGHFARRVRGLLTSLRGLGVRLLEAVAARASVASQLAAHGRPGDTELPRDVGLRVRPLQASLSAPSFRYRSHRRRLRLQRLPPRQEHHAALVRIRRCPSTRSSSASLPCACASVENTGGATAAAPMRPAPARRKSRRELVSSPLVSTPAAEILAWFNS